MLHRANVLPFAMGAVTAFLLSAVIQFAPNYDSQNSFSFSIFKAGQQEITLRQPLASFQETWSLLPSPQPSTRRFATSTERVCVMASDTRPLTLVTDDTQPSKLDFRTFAVYHNLWWSLRHGYTYRMVHTEAQKGYDPIWTKTRAIRDMVASPECELVVFFDSDAYITQPSYSIYDLLDRWGFHDRAAMLLAMDQPNHPMPENKNATNTGFMVFRSGAKALQILDDIIACPETIPGCEHWKIYEKYEQTAFNVYIRPKLVEGEELIIIPCDDANGNFKNKFCHGKFVTHAWHALDSVTERAAEIMVKETFSWLSRVFDGQRIVRSPSSQPATIPAAPPSRRHNSRSLNYHQADR